MSSKKILGIIVIIVGVALVLASVIMRNRNPSASVEVFSTDRNMDHGNRGFSRDSREGRGNVSTHREVYQVTQEGGQDQSVLWLEIGGIILLLLGAGIVFIGKKRK